MYGRMAGTVCTCIGSIRLGDTYQTLKSDWWMLPGRACQLVPNYGEDPGATLVHGVGPEFNSTRLNSPATLQLRALRSMCSCHVETYDTYVAISSGLPFDVMTHHRFVRRKRSRHGSGVSDVLRGALSSLVTETGLIICWLGSAEVPCGAALRIPQA